MLDTPSPESNESRALAAENATAARNDAPGPIPVEVGFQQPTAETRYQTAMLFFICLMMGIYLLYFARFLVLPILVAILLKLVLAPLVRFLTRFRVPEALGAALVLILATASIGYGAYSLSAPATEWVTKIPERLAILRVHIRSIKEPFEFIRQAGESLSQLSTFAETGSAQTVAATAAVAAPMDGLSISTVMLSETASVTASMISMVVLLYFLLAAGDLFLRKLVNVLPTFGDKKQAVEIAHRVQSDISYYLFTITMINAGLGAITGMALYFYGMPSPWLWAAMVAIFNFVPFLGPAVCVGVVMLVSFMSFPQWQVAAVPPLLVLGLCALEGQFVTPMILARRLVLNPVAVFIALLFCGWLWGIVGVLLSVPLLAVLKIFCDQVRPLTPIGEFLER